MWRTLAFTTTNEVLLFWSVKWMSWLVIIIYTLLMFTLRDSAIGLIIAKLRSWKYFVSFLLYYKTRYNIVNINWWFVLTHSQISENAVHD